MSDNIRQAIEEYRAKYDRELRDKEEKRFWTPLIHRLLERCGLQDVGSVQTIDIVWGDPRVPIVGEIKTPTSGEFNPQPSQKPDWGYIKTRKQNKELGWTPPRNQHGDGLAQLHLVMREEHAPYGIFTNGEEFLVYHHTQPFSIFCFADAPVEKRCGFPQHDPIHECNLLTDEVEKIEEVLRFLHNLWDESQKNW